MPKFNLQTNPSSYRRAVAKSPEAVMRNRFIEANPVLNDTEYSYISRPGMKKWIEVGAGPIRKVFNEPGVFGGDLFVVSGLSLYRVKIAGTVTNLGVISTNVLNDVSMTASAPVGSFPANLYIAEGGILSLYTDNGSARGTLTLTGVITSGEQVRIADTYYQFTSGSVNTGTPLGTSGSPWLVAVGVSTNKALNNLFNAINQTGLAGTDYSTATVEHTTVSATIAPVASALVVQADAAGLLGDSIVTTETLVSGSWGGGTLTGGGLPQLRTVPVPDDRGAVSVAHINSYIVVVVIQDEVSGSVGRFYWVNPGENTVDALNFATAERSPDKLNQVIVFNDMFWLLGEKTVEPWITTGAAAAPMQRYRPILVDRGSWGNTATKVKDSLIMIDEDGAVFQIKGQSTRISTPQIEERLRKGIQLEKKTGLASRMRGWSFTLDGHDYYVVKVGVTETLIYDPHSGQWYVWGSGTLNLWNAVTGENWVNSGTLSQDYGSNIVVGDSGNGALYFLAPELPTDDDAVLGAASVKTFTREFQGQIHRRSYGKEKVFSVDLLGSIGQPGVATLTDVTLSYSDDRGLTYVSAGTITIANNDVQKRVDWRSLGSFGPPGRMFKVVDTGALHRIDSLTIETDRNDSGP